MQQFYTVGMAGHIDHGKTSLTKALTGIDTDRLKEEKERNISIEPGFAPLYQSDELQISIIDVPGHERFIRQMIAGVAGVDFVVLVIAGDEGVMPQTREHLAILSLLGMKHGMIAITKIDEVDDELLEVVKQDIVETVKGTFLERAPMYFVDSISLTGIEAFKLALIEAVKQTEKRPTYQSFRLPIDQVFTVKGHGVVVRGTVFDGQVRMGDSVIVLPLNEPVRVRQIQSHHKEKEVVFAGQRAALNLGGITHHELKRGHVLVADDFYTISSRIDVVFSPLEEINYVVKQRQQIKFYVGTEQVSGSIIFFDRNELAKRNQHDDEIFVQIELEDPVVVTRGDRFILRRASPVETLGGGWIIDANAKKHRFGDETIEQLKRVKEGTTEERINLLLEREFIQTKEAILRLAAVTEEEFNEIKDRLVQVNSDRFTLLSVLERVSKEVVRVVKQFHEQFTLRQGIHKAELISALQVHFSPVLLEYVINQLLENKKLIQIDDMLAKATFIPKPPKGWEKRIENLISEWEKQGAEVEKIAEIFSRYHIDSTLHDDLYHYLLHTNRAYEFDEGRLIAQKSVREIKDKMYVATKGLSFTLQSARDITGLSRKNLIPLLELFDRLQFTKRVENERIWLS